MPRVNKRIKKQQINPQTQKADKFMDYSSLLNNHNSVDFIEFYQNFMVNDKKTNNINNNSRYNHEPIKIHLNESINNASNGNCNDSKLLKLLKEEGLIMNQVKKRERFTFDESFILYKCSGRKLD